MTWMWTTTAVKQDKMTRNNITTTSENMDDINRGQGRSLIIIIILLQDFNVSSSRGVQLTQDELTESEGGSETNLSPDPSNYTRNVDGQKQ